MTRQDETVLSGWALAPERDERAHERAEVLLDPQIADGQDVASGRGRRGPQGQGGRLGDDPDLPRVDPIVVGELLAREARGSDDELGRLGGPGGEHAVLGA